MWRGGWRGGACAVGVCHKQTAFLDTFSLTTALTTPNLLLLLLAVLQC